jgi:hypothetical protein
VHQIVYECFDPSGLKTDVGNAHTVNISERGALIETSRGVDLDASLILWIREPFHTILVKGNVVHSRGVADGLFHVGVKLTDVIEGSWEIWKRLVELRDEDLTE